MPNINIALLHYPVVGKDGQTIASAVTNLDLHDIARAAKTYGIKRYYVVTPLEDQKKLVDEIVSHWVTGYGATYNPKRREAMALVKIKDAYEDVVADIRLAGSGEPKTIVTTARESASAIGYTAMRRQLHTDTCPYLLVFGTAWGLGGDIIEKADYILKPISGKEAYNHLSVRSAASIILDRLLG